MNRLKYSSVTLHTLRSHTKINEVEAIWCPFWNAILADKLCLTHLWICPLGHHFPISCFNRTPKWAFVHHEFIVLNCSSLLLEAPCSHTVIPSSCFPHMSIITKKPSQNTPSSWSKLQELMDVAALSLSSPAMVWSDWNTSHGCDTTLSLRGGILCWGGTGNFHPAFHPLV